MPQEQSASALLVGMLSGRCSIQAGLNFGAVMLVSVAVTIVAHVVADVYSTLVLSDGAVV